MSHPRRPRANGADQTPPVPAAALDLFPDGAFQDVVFLPLGGTGEIGLNLYLYGYRGKWLMVDCGVTFGDDTTPGVDVLMADPSFIEQRKDSLVGLVLTHGHEDHLGAIQYLWDRLGVPVYCTPFTAAYLRLKLRDSDFIRTVEIQEIPLGGTIDLAPFAVEFVTMTHSVPEPNALAIRVGDRLVVHSGDWKLDGDPQLGTVTDADRLRQLGEEGVDALICDSTNVFEPGHTGSEGEVLASLTKLFGQLENRIAITCFSTNIARINSIAKAAHANGRHAALIGRSLWRVTQAAEETGYLTIPEPFVGEKDAGFLPADKLVLICTGSQGEPRSALTRIAQGDHPNIVLNRGDCVIYSAREIPGNEKAIGRVQDNLERAGVTVITPDDHPEPVHVSGHPARQELIQMYQWLQPKIAVPMHGTHRHLQAHARLARSCQVPEAVVPADGQPVVIHPGQARTIAPVPVARLALDGTRLMPLGVGALRNRFKVVNQGAAVASLVMDAAGALLDDPQLTLFGLEDTDEIEDLADEIIDDIQDAVEALSDREAKNDDKVRDCARVAVRRGLRRFHGKKPWVEIHLTRL